MTKENLIKNIFITCGLFLILVSCTHILALEEGETTAIRSELNADDYASEIARSLEIAQHHPAPSKRKNISP